MICEEILENLKNKNSLAYKIGSNSYTYKDLYKYVCNIYNYLNVRNVEKKPVVVYGHKDIYMKATMVACLMAGIAYVPVDDSIPMDRVLMIIEQVKPFAIIGDFYSDSTLMISKSLIEEIMNGDVFEDIERPLIKENDIAYMIFTSGSTGVPKGVMISYEALNSCIYWLKNLVFLKEDCAIMNQANFSFDLSVADFYLSLIYGCCHLIVENDNKLDFKNTFDEIRDSGISCAVFTPSYADLLMVDKGFNKELLPKLENIIFCGEKLLNRTVLKLKERFQGVNIINCYGPTEATFAVTAVEVDGKEEEIPAGYAKDGVSLVIVDEERNVLHEGQLGEILIVGDSVALGYLGGVKKESFIEYEGRRGYFTGDLGYINDGVLYCRGRMDFQIKFKGYRIELLDIEENLMGLNFFENVKVVPKFDRDENVNGLIAFVKVIDGVNITDEEIVRKLGLVLPKYMIPKIKRIDNFPTNDNGKIDIKQLRRLV